MSFGGNFLHKLVKKTQMKDNEPVEVALVNPSQSNFPRLLMGSLRQLM